MPTVLNALRWFRTILEKSTCLLSTVLSPFLSSLYYIIKNTEVTFISKLMTYYFIINGLKVEFIFFFILCSSLLICSKLLFYLRNCYMWCSILYCVFNKCTFIYNCFFNYYKWILVQSYLILSSVYIRVTSFAVKYIHIKLMINACYDNGYIIL